MQTSLPTRTLSSELLSLTRPGKQWIVQQRALLRRATPAFPFLVSDKLSSLIKLDEHMSRNRGNTFIVKVSGQAMSGHGILEGDILAVDSAWHATNGSIVIVQVDGKITIRQLFCMPSGHILRAAHPGYEDIALQDQEDLRILGVVRWNIHQH